MEQELDLSGLSSIVQGMTVVWRRDDDC